MPLFELDDVFTYQDANDIKKLWAAESEPTDPAVGEVWLDISTSPLRLKRYNGSGWDVIAGTSASELLETLKTVDGSGSGLDADKLDNQEGSFYQNASNLNAGTIPLDRIPTTLTGKNADQLDGQDGSFYQNASNLDAGTVPLAQIPTSLTGKNADQLDGLEGTQFIRNDSDSNVNANTKWQDGYQVRIGSSSDIRIQHDGSNSFIDNYTGQLLIRQLLHGGNIYLQAENTSGTMQDILTLNPNTVCAKVGGAVLSELYNVTLGLNDVLTTNIKFRSTGILFVRSDGWSTGAIYEIATDNNTYVNLWQGNGSFFSDVKDTDLRFNVYFEDDYIKIQNKRGSSLVKVGFFGCRFDG